MCIHNVIYTQGPRRPGCPGGGRPARAGDSGPGEGQGAAGPLKRVIIICSSSSSNNNVTIFIMMCFIIIACYCYFVVYYDL